MIVLDTHALIWYVNEDPRIPESTWNYIHRQDAILLSSITAWGIILSPAMGAVLISLSTLIVAINARFLKMESVS